MFFWNSGCVGSNLGHQTDLQKCWSNTQNVPDANDLIQLRRWVVFEPLASGPSGSELGLSNLKAPNPMVLHMCFPFDTIVWHIKKVRHKHMLEFPLSTLICGWIEALHFFLILLASDGVLRGGSDGVFPDLDQRHQWISYCLKAPMWDCWRWKIWRWGQLRSPHDSGKKIWPGYVCSSMLTRTNIRII